MRLRQVLSCASLLLLLASALQAQEEDPFDAIDRQLDAGFAATDEVINNRYEAVNKAVDRAFKGLSRRIEVSWGEDVKLPSQDEWVTYSKDMNSRVAVDFSEAEIVIETVVLADSDLEKNLAELAAFASKLLAATNAELNQQDSLVQDINQELKAGGVVLDTLPAPQPVNDSAGAAASVLSEVLPIAEIQESLQELKIAQVQVLEEGGVKKAQVRFAFLSNAQARLIESQLDVIRQFADEYDVPVSVVLAIIETESSFNPRAVSPVPAFGLMQLVPRTAGVDAYSRVHGEKKVVSAEFLFNEQNNIQLGTAYLGMVRDRYLRKIENRHSRFYCAVAAYNTGVGNVAKTFVGTTSLNAAARKINGMTAQEVYDYLQLNLPAEETRNYLRKIVDRAENYKHFDLG